MRQGWVRCWMLALALVWASSVGCSVPRLPMPGFLRDPGVQYELETLEGLGLQDFSRPASEPADLRDDPTGVDSVVTPVPGVYEELLAEPVAEQIALRVEDARASALVNNLELRVQLVEPQIAEAGISEEEGRFESILGVPALHQRLDTPPAFPGSDRTIDTVTPTLEVPMLTGGQLLFDHDMTRVDPHFAPPPEGDTDNLTRFTATFTQPLLRDFGYQVNSTGIRIAQLNSGIAEAETKLRAIQVVAAVETAYWNLQRSYRLLEVFRQQLTLAERQVANARRLAEAGLLTQVDVSQFETAAALRRVQVINGETDLRIAQRNLKLIMQRPDAPVGSPTRLDTITPPTIDQLRFDREAIALLAVNNRMELLQLRLQMEIDQTNIEFEQNQTLPRFDFITQLRPRGSDPNYLGSLDNLFSGEFSERFIGLTLELPLSGNVSARSRLRQAQLRLAQNQIQQRQIAINVRREVFDAIDRIEQNWRRVAVAQQAVEFAQQTYDKRLRLVEVGESTATDLLFSLNDLAEAQLGEANAIADYKIAEVELAFAAGAILGYGNIQWPIHW